MKALYFIFLVSLYPYILAAVYAYQTKKRTEILRNENDRATNECYGSGAKADGRSPL